MMSAYNSQVYSLVNWVAQVHSCMQALQTEGGGPEASPACAEVRRSSRITEVPL